MSWFPRLSPKELSWKKTISMTFRLVAIQGTIRISGALNVAMWETSPETVTIANARGAATRGSDLGLDTTTGYKTSSRWNATREVCSTPDAIPLERNPRICSTPDELPLKTKSEVYSARHVGSYYPNESVIANL